MRAEMLAKMEANQERMDSRIEANNEKFEVLKSTLVTQMDAHHGKTEASHEESMAARKASHEMIEALMNVSLEGIQTFQDAENERKDIVKGSAPSETEKETALRIRAGDVGALATLK
jgi:hypothetical protein